MRKLNQVVIQLGTNIGSRLINLELALFKITNEIGEITKISSIYESMPWGQSEQPKFLNRLIVIDSNFSAMHILELCQSIEQSMGPSKLMEWGARIMDLDLLFYENEVIESEQLILPHPRIQDRRFILEPLNEILPNLIHPVLNLSVSDLLKKTDDTLEVKIVQESTASKYKIKYQYIAIEGNIGAGKTTFAEMLASKFDARLILEQFSDNPFLPFFYKEPERFAFPVELFFMTERHKQLQENLLQQNMFSDFVVADYFFLKTLLFAGNNLQQEELRLFQRLFNILNASFPQPELLIYFHRPVDVLLKQIKSRGREYEANISETYLLEIQQIYLDYFSRVDNFPIVLVDINENDFKDDPFIFEKLIELLQKDYKNGLNRVSI